MGKEIVGSGGIRTHASEETGALNQRLRPLGHAASNNLSCLVYVAAKFNQADIIDLWKASS